MKCNLCCDDNCLDLPSLTEMKGSGKSNYQFIGHAILESMI